MTEKTWDEIVKYNSIQFEREKEEKQKKLKEQKQKMKEELNRQIAEKKIEKVREDRDLQSYAEMQNQLA